VDLPNYFDKLQLLEGADFAVGSTEKLLANPKLTRITRLALIDYQNLRKSGKNPGV
jgi:hypothetical protein